MILFWLKEHTNDYIEEFAKLLRCLLRLISKSFLHKFYLWMKLESEIVCDQKEDYNDNADRGEIKMMLFKKSDINDCRYGNDDVKHREQLPNNKQKSRIKVLGTGCVKCRKQEEHILEALKVLGIHWQGIEPNGNS